MPQWFEKDTDEVLDFQIDWSTWLGSDTISTSTWTVPSGITKNSDTNTTTTATIWLSGGVVGEVYEVQNRIVTDGGRTADDVIFVTVIDRSPARDGMRYLIHRLRALTNAGTADYSLAGVTYWSDGHLQDTLDRHSTWLTDYRLAWIEENISGTTNYLTAAIGYKNLENAESGSTRWQVRQTNGTAEGTANYSADYVNGRITWSSDQGGTAYMLTGYSYDVYGAAVDILQERLASVDLWYDFRADNQQFSRSQVRDGIEARMKMFAPMVGDNLPGKSGDVMTAEFVRTDLR